MIGSQVGALPVILVTGGSGQVGHELQRALSALATVHAPSHSALDLAAKDSIRACVRSLRPDVIINAGAYTAVDDAESDQVVAQLVNADAPGILAREAAAIGSAMIHFSTDYVFDGRKGGAYVEDDVPAPISVYGATKLEGEEAVRASGVPHLILRTSWVYGRRGRNFLNTILRLAREREELRIVDDQVGAPTWSRSIASATATMMRRLAVPAGIVAGVQDVSGTYHLTSSGATSWYGFASAALALDPGRDEQRCARLVPIRSEEYPTPARRPANSRLDCSRFLQVFGVAIPAWGDELARALEG